MECWEVLEQLLSEKKTEEEKYEQWPLWFTVFTIFREVIYYIMKNSSFSTNFCIE